VRRASALLVFAASLALVVLPIPAQRAFARPDAVVRAGPLRAEVRARPWSIVFRQRRGQALREAGGVPGRRALRLRRIRRGVEALVGARAPALRVLLRARGDGVVSLEVRALARDAETVGERFAARPGERFLGFGERSNALDQRGNAVESYVSDGPFRPEDRAVGGAIRPPWARGERDDSTYYPVPWLLSSRGYGVLVDDDATSRFALAPGAGRSWRVRVQGRRLALRVFAGPTPAAALARFTASTGRQPAPAAPWAYGPWVQTGQPNVIPADEERGIFRTLRDADAPVSAAETQMHYLPCGAQRGREAAERARTAALHGLGVARLVYFNPSLCASYGSVYDRAAAAGALQRGPDGRPFTYPSFVGGGGAAGFTVEPLAQWDFTASATPRLYGALLREAVAGHGADGWMEDFGEDTPPSVRLADGSTGTAAHNRYPRDYHCAVQRLSRRLPRPVVRFQRSGWTGAARCADDVWGGDPTTVWDFDGLRSALVQGLSIGLSGVSRWGSDIGGYNSFGPRERLSPELLTRWIELGAVSGVMRTKRSGIALPPYERPQVYDPAHIGVWRRYAKLRTALYPYLTAADATYRRTGLPLMRHLALVYPNDRRAIVQDGELMFGPDLLAAPVTSPGQRRKAIYLPRGRWLDFWRSVTYDRGGRGGFEPRRARLEAGGRTRTLAAPVGRLPLLLRAGAVVPLLPAEVDTLAPYRAPGVVRLADRRARLELLAFPRGRSSARFGLDGRLRSRERRGGWTLALDGRRRRAFTLRAGLSALRRPFRPRAVRLDGRALRFRYEASTRVLTVAFAARSGRLVVQR
jgi:alpha-glucosidase (family GH31 glycosyl hydrolase)